MFVIKLVLFVTGTAAIVWVSRTSLRDRQSHGFYRTFAWEVILVSFVLNINYWFVDPFSPRQMIAWILLVISLLLIVLGVQAFRRQGNIDPGRADPTLVGVEKTTRLVSSGVYHYIRHPFYSSLLFLTWGIFFKHMTGIGFLLGILASLLLFITAKKEEAENTAYFGAAYQAYMQRTKMFIPYIL
jgi:protein-S-isoprenylcysteine O-methyltransferase Ste14